MTTSRVALKVLNQARAERAGFRHEFHIQQPERRAVHLQPTHPVLVPGGGSGLVFRGQQP
jgi:hypothetical protein